METVKNPFSALVELKQTGDHVVVAKVWPSVRLDRFDAAYVSRRILDLLLPSYAVEHLLFDGSFVVVSGDDSRYVTNTCFAAEDRSLAPISASLELPDGLVHGVVISLEQSKSTHRDYSVLSTRYVELRGSISIEGDEEVEE